MKIKQNSSSSTYIIQPHEKTEKEECQRNCMAENGDESTSHTFVYRVAIVLLRTFYNKTRQRKKTRSQHNLDLEWLIHIQCKYWTGSLMEYANYECSFANSLVNCLTKNLHIIRVCLCVYECEWVYVALRVFALRRNEVKFN